MHRVHVVVVTHNSEKFLDWSIKPLINLEFCYITIVDSGSSDKKYLQKYISANSNNLRALLFDNIGFVRANNAALADPIDAKYTLFLNPDARIERIDLERLLNFADNSDNSLGIYTVPLHRFDIEERLPLGTFDSCGIFQSWYGRWFDKTNDDLKSGEYSIVPAVCGALLLVKNSLLSQIRDSNGCVGFETNFFMYKEDIEISLRFSERGYKSAIFWGGKAFHCRGWKGRSNIPYVLKLESAKNDVYIAQRYRTGFTAYAYLKFFFVKNFGKLLKFL